MSDRRVPENILEFNTYITSTDTFLQAISSGIIHNWERLGLTIGMSTGWNDARNVWDPLFVLWNSELTRTKGVTADVHTFIKNFTDTTRPVLNLIASSPNAVSSDGVMFHLVIDADRAHPTHPTTPLTDGCVVGFERLGGGSIRLSFRKAGDTARPSIIDGADSVQVAVKIGGAAPPASPAGLVSEVLTRAIIVHDFGTENIGQYLYLYVRFYNTKYPELAGPWSILYTVMIS